MRYGYDSNFDAIGALQRARAQQLQSLMMMRANSFPQSSGVQQRPSVPTFGSYYGNDTVTLGGQTWGAGAGSNDRLWNGQSIEELFANPYANQPDMAYLQESLEKLAAAKRMFGTQPAKKQGAKGDLRVIAGDRSDGVKPKEVRIDDANSYDWQKSENSYQGNRQEARFKDGTVGREYDVTVTWEDGTTTKKRVTLKQPGQIVYMDTSYSY